jgi:transposase
VRRRTAALLNHKTRDFLVRQRTQLVNTIRAHLSEFGIVTPKACLRHDAGEVGGGEAPNGSVAEPQDAFARSLGRIAFAGSPSSASAPSS